MERGVRFSAVDDSQESPAAAMDIEPVKADVVATSDSSAPSLTADQRPQRRKPRWSMGILEDPETDEVPGSVLLLSPDRNEPLGLTNAPARTSASSFPSDYGHSAGAQPAPPSKKLTRDGTMILDPQPEDTLNDPLNWSVLRRDAALFSLGLYCMVGGGMTPILAAGFTNVAATYDVGVPQVALTTGLYMMGLGLGSVVASPTAIAFGKRPVYLVAAVLFILTSVWCALSPSYVSLVIARIVQGMAVSPVECLPSATIAEIFFLHERAYRLGIYTLLLLGGKNLVPLVSAAVIQSLGWRWVFWIVAMVVAFCAVLLFLFVPETFWDRTPRSHKARQRRPSFRRGSTVSQIRDLAAKEDASSPSLEKQGEKLPSSLMEEEASHLQKQAPHSQKPELTEADIPYHGVPTEKTVPAPFPSPPGFHSDSWRVAPSGAAPPTPVLQNLNDPAIYKSADSYFSPADAERALSSQDSPSAQDHPSAPAPAPSAAQPYTKFYRSQPPKSFKHSLRPYSGRLNHDNWFRVAFRPFILFAYPSILWSTAVYALSVGWLIVLSESVATIYRAPDAYNFTALQTGLVYISPFVGGILGTAVAGKISDVVVRAMAARNGGLYEPEFRLVMAAPVALATAVGLMGYGWSAQERDAWIVPTVFFGVIAFGCTLGSTTAITFAVDSYRMYAGEALVTLNFSKNIFHGLVFSLFFNRWLDADGARTVFICLGAVQLFFLLFTVPMYMYGKRARMWTVRRNFMEKF